MQYNDLKELELKKDLPQEKSSQIFTCRSKKHTPDMN